MFGKELQLVKDGSIEDLRKKISESQRAHPDNVFAWVFEQYKFCMFSGKGKILQNERDRYPALLPMQSIRTFFELIRDGKDPRLAGL